MLNHLINNLVNTSKVSGGQTYFEHNGQTLVWSYNNLLHELWASNLVDFEIATEQFYDNVDRYWYPSGMLVARVDGDQHPATLEALEWLAESYLNITKEVA